MTAPIPLTEDERIQILKERVWFIATGDTLMRQDDNHLPPRIIAPVADGTDRPAVWLEQLPTPDHDSPRVNSRAHFRVSVEMQVGTIDELVEGFRQDLLKAADMMLGMDHLGLRHRDTVASRTAAARLGYTPGAASKPGFLKPYDELAVESLRSHLAACDYYKAHPIAQGETACSTDVKP